MAEEQPQAKRSLIRPPGWLIVCAFAVGLMLFLFRSMATRGAFEVAEEPSHYHMACMVGSGGAPGFTAGGPSNPNAFTSTSGRNQLLLGEKRDGEEVILLTVETKPGGANGCGVLIITGEQTAVVEWVSDLDHDHDSPPTRRRDSKVHTTGTTEWDVPCRVSDD